MKILNYKSNFLISVLLLLTSCNKISESRVDSIPNPISQTSLPKKKIANIDLTTIKHIEPKGRVQDGSLEGENFVKLTIADDLLAYKKDCIPFLISKLDDETEMKRGTVDFWYQVYVGDIALIILTNFFTKTDEKTSTIPGFAWDEFLERGNDKDSMGEEILRRYIKKHGRKNIKERWQKMWEVNKENIYWNETEKCFDVKRAGA